MVVVFAYIKRMPSVWFTTVSMDKMEVKIQQVQTEIVKTVEQHIQAGSTAQQQGVYTTHYIPLCHIFIRNFLVVILQIRAYTYQEGEILMIQSWSYSYILILLSDLFSLFNNSDTCTVV